MIIAADLRPADAGAFVSFATGPMIRGHLDAVSHTGVEGLTTLTVDGTDYVVDPHTLVHVDDEHLLAIVADVGRLNVLERANHVALMHHTITALVPRPRSAGWDDIAAPWED